jgi:hypothetical protein
MSLKSFPQKLEFLVSSSTNTLRFAINLSLKACYSRKIYSTTCHHMPSHAPIHLELRWPSYENNIANCSWHLLFISNICYMQLYNNFLYTALDMYNTNIVCLSYILFTLPYTYYVYLFSDGLLLSTYFRYYYNRSHSTYTWYSNVLSLVRISK